MPCTITDKVVTFANSNVPVPIVGVTVAAQPAAEPIFTSAPPFRPVFNPHRKDITDSTGLWSFILPWPSESDPDVTQWQIQLPDFSVWQGTVPQDVPGPVSIHDLHVTYGWQLVAGGPQHAAPIVVSAGSRQTTVPVVDTPTQLPIAPVNGLLSIIRNARSGPFPDIAFSLDGFWRSAFNDAIIGPTPQISAFSAPSGTAGDAISIFGAGFTGATEVRIGGGMCVYTIVSDIQIDLTLSLAAVTGKVSVKAPSGLTGFSVANFIVTDNAFGVAADALGCTLRWRLVDTSYADGFVGDASGHTNSGLVNGGPSIVTPGIVAGDPHAASGNSFSQFIIGPTLPAQPAFTIAGFFKFPDFSADSCDLGSGASKFYVLSGGTLEFANSFDILDAPGTLSINTRYFIAVTADGTTMTIFVNGVQVASQPSTTTWISNAFDFAQSFTWDGVVQELMYFPSALSAGQLLSLYNLA